MKKSGILHPEILRLLGEIGHTDRIVIADAGLPIPTSTPRIDLAWIQGEPTFGSVLKAITDEMFVESITLATEIQTKNPQILKRVKETLSSIPISYVDHEEFKNMLLDVKAVIRTGECTPYANCILHAGVFG